MQVKGGGSGFRGAQDAASDLRGGVFDDPGVLKALLRREPLARVQLPRIYSSVCRVLGSESLVRFPFVFQGLRF